MTHLLYVLARALFWWVILFTGLFIGRSGFWEGGSDEPKLPPPADHLRPR